LNTANPDQTRPLTVNYGVIGSKTMPPN